MLSGLQKHQRIKDVLKKLFDLFGETNFYLTDYWDADSCAVGIRKAGIVGNLIYLSTYKIKKSHYFVEVEDSNQEVILNGYKNGELCERSFEELSEIVEKYLHMQRIYEQ